MPKQRRGLPITSKEPNGSDARHPLFGPSFKSVQDQQNRQRRQEKQKQSKQNKGIQQLLQHGASDVKMAGMLLLSELYPLPKLATMGTLERLNCDLWNYALPSSLEDDECFYINDWSTADWFALKVLSKQRMTLPLFSKKYWDTRNCQVVMLPCGNGAVGLRPFCGIIKDFLRMLQYRH
jgi:hypothetical protein